METFELFVVAESEKHLDAWVNILGHELALLAGGFTAYRGSGGWMDDEGNYVSNERVARLHTFCPPDLTAKELYSMLSFTILQYKENCAQDTVLVVVNGQPYFLKKVPSTLE